MEETENYLKILKLVHVKTALVLRTVFRDKWHTYRKTQWENTTVNAKDLITLLGEKIFLQRAKIQKELLQSGRIEAWDVSLLSVAIRTLIVEEDKNSWRSTKKESELQNLDVIINTRNYISHSATLEIEDEDFKVRWSSLVNALKFFGANDEDLQITPLSISQICEDPSTLINESNTQKAKILKDVGDNFLSTNEVQKAIDKYSEALLISSISILTQIELYTSRATAYLQLYPPKHEEALEDSAQAANLKCDSWKSYLLISKCYEIQGNFTMALKNFDIALALDPVNTEINFSRNMSKFKATLNKLETSGSLSRTVRACVISFLKKRNLPETESNIKNHLEKIMKGQSAFKFVLEGHTFREGKDIAQDWKKAVKCYSKAHDMSNAEGTFNLALLTMQGKGINQDNKEGLRLLKNLATEKPFLGDVEGVLEENLEPNVGVAEAEFCLGLYYEGLGDFRKAVTKYGKSSEHHFGLGGFHAGRIFYQGKGFPVMKDQAVQFWQGATNDFCGENLFAEEALTRHFISVENYEDAWYWYNRVVLNGSESFLSHLETFQTRLTRLQNMKQRLCVTVQMLREERDNDKMQNLSRLIKLFQVSINEEIDDVLGCPFSESVKEVFDCSHIIKNLFISNLENKSPYSADQIRKWKKMAKKGNITAEHLLKTADLFLEVLKVFSQNELDEDSKSSAIKNMANAIRLQHYFIMMSQESKAKLRSLVEEYMSKIPVTEISDLDRDVRVVYLFLLMEKDLDSVISLIPKSKEKYPQEEFFYTLFCSAYALKKDFQITVREINKALELFPQSHELLYQKAKGQFALPFISEEEKISDLLAFANIADKGDRLLADAYYSLALCYEKMATRPQADKMENWKYFKKYYFMAKKAEETSAVKPPDTPVKARAQEVYDITNAFQQ